MHNNTELYRQGLQLIYTGGYLQAIDCFLVFAQTYPDRAADAYERIACCYFNLDCAIPLPHLSFSQRLKARRVLQQEARAGYQWAVQQGIERQYCRAAAWNWKALQIMPEHVESLNQLARFLPHASQQQRAFEQQAHQAALNEGRIPPDDPADVGGWERFWQYRIRQENPAGLTFLIEIVEPLIPTLRKRGLHTVLCLGNGISLEPRAFAHTGYEVTALDLSPVAGAFAHAFPAFDAYIPHFFSTDLARAGGSATYVVGDMLDPDCVPGAFDVISVRRVIQCFPEEQHERVLQAIISRLAPHGVLILHDHNAGNNTADQLSRQNFHISFGQLKDSFHFDEAAPGFLAAPEGMRIAWLIRTSG